MNTCHKKNHLRLETQCQLNVYLTLQQQIKIKNTAFGGVRFCTQSHSTHTLFHDQKLCVFVFFKCLSTYLQGSVHHTR